MSEERCFCGSPWFRSMHGRRPLCESHWWEWRKRVTARLLKRAPELVGESRFFRELCEAFGLLDADRRGEQGELFGRSA